MLGAIILAAGASRRMGEQKLLLPYAGQPLIRHIVEQVLHAAPARIVVVTGHDRDGVQDALQGIGVIFAHNGAYESGMLSSVRTGLRALPPDADIMIVLGDQPSIPSKAVAALMDRLREQPDEILVPTVQGRRGHPLVFGARYRDDVLCKYEDVGLRGLLREYAEHVHEIPFDEPGLIEDLDTPEDYQAALRRLNQNRISKPE